MKLNKLLIFITSLCLAWSLSACGGGGGEGEQGGETQNAQWGNSNWGEANWQ